MNSTPRSSAISAPRPPATPYLRSLGQIGTLEAAYALARLRRAIRDKSVAKLVEKAQIDPRKCVVVTHQRLARLNEEVPGGLLHLFGHPHKFSEHAFKATKYVNVAALDRPVSARPRVKQKWQKQDCRNFNAGNYTTIEIDCSEAITIRCKLLAQDYPDWIPLEDGYNGIEWIPEETQWTNASDRPLTLRSTGMVRPHDSL